MSKTVEWAVAAARDFLVNDGTLSAEEAATFTKTRLCGLLGLVYTDGSKPHGKLAKMKALVSWATTRRMIVEKPAFVERMQAAHAASRKSKSVADRRLIDSAAASAASQQSRMRKSEYQLANSEKFLTSYEWARARKDALTKYGPVCQCCGASPATGAVMHVDHIKPRKLFPQLALDVDNLQILCADCNRGKANGNMTDWRKASSSPAKVHQNGIQ